MKTAMFNKTHFLLTVLLISFAMLLATHYFATEANKLYADITLAFNGFVTALVAFLLIQETNKSSRLHEALLQREKKLSDTLNSLGEHQSAEKAARELNENLEVRVKERTEDLEFFAYSVSHDLRAPLRAINGFAKILKEDCKETLDENGKHLLSTIASNAQRMDRLIEDLLNLSRLGRAELRKSSINMQTLVAGVVDDLKLSNQNFAAEVIMNTLPNAHCDIGLMRQVWINLLSNAAKYSANNPAAKIEVGFTQKGGADVYYVKDNGVGFDMQHADKLFGIFQRLHTADEFKGTGVGLVIVQRVIKKHGGRVFAESESGKGASFYFALPEMN